jgi:hypothetical protein
MSGSRKQDLKDRNSPWVAACSYLQSPGYWYCQRLKELPHGAGVDVHVERRCTPVLCRKKWPPEFAFKLCFLVRLIDSFAGLDWPRATECVFES